MKPLNLILGLAGACAACCAIPLAVPLIGTLAAGGVIVSFGDGGELIAALGVAGLVAFLIWRYGRSQRAACESVGSGGCGCAAPDNPTHDLKPAPIACTLTQGDLKEPVQWIRNLAHESLRDARREPLALHLTYDVSAASRVRQMVRKEKVWCAFLHFDLREDAGGVHLSIVAPEDARETANDLFAHFAPELAASPSSAIQKENV
ncbi:MAG: hypothetical protein JWR80_2616 [Bradyrhizobium sp.]|nr:hypothetical protein [Bradyrhizobium sp.]